MENETQAPETPPTPAALPKIKKTRQASNLPGFSNSVKRQAPKIEDCYVIGVAVRTPIADLPKLMVDALKDSAAKKTGAKYAQGHIYLSRDVA